MYTRCPSCRSEISFDPPANKDSLPENYRHRIKCPSCGVTIGVKINQAPQILSQPIRPQLAAPPGARGPQQRPPQGAGRQNPYAPPRQNAYGNNPRGNQKNNAYVNQRNAGYANQRPYGQTPYYPPQQQNNYGTRTNGYEEPQRTPYYPPEQEEIQKPNKKSASDNSKRSKAKADSKAKSNQLTAKKYGTGRNIMMMLFSLIFVAFSAVSYLIAQGTITLPDAFKWVSGISFFDGISVWASIFKDFETFKALTGAMGALGTFATIVPLLLFTLSCINFIVAFVSAIGRKYGRAFNLLFSLIIGGLAATALFAPYLIASSNTDVIGYLVDVIGMDGGAGYMAIAGAVVGVLQFIFALLFTKSLKRKEPAEDKKSVNKGNAKSRKNSNSKSSKKGKK